MKLIRRWELLVYLVVSTTIGFWIGRLVEAYASTR